MDHQSLGLLARVGMEEVELFLGQERHQPPVDLVDEDATAQNNESRKNRRLKHLESSSDLPVQKDVEDGLGHVRAREYRLQQPPVELLLDFNRVFKHVQILVFFPPLHGLLFGVFGVGTQKRPHDVALYPVLLRVAAEHSFEDLQVVPELVLRRPLVVFDHFSITHLLQVVFIGVLVIGGFNFH
mgnify:CR=1 FL=1